MVVRNESQIRAGRFMAVVAATAAILVSGGAAEARGRHLFHRHAYSQHVPHAGRVALGSTAANFSAIVVDANSGRTLYDVNADAPRHPASITKVMTLYLLFEQIDKGHASRSTPVCCRSRQHAASGNRRRSSACRQAARPSRIDRRDQSPS